MGFAFPARLRNLQEGWGRLRGRMSHRLLLAALLAALALTPVALADHAYSHRYVVYGRVVDVDGTPVQGVLVDLGTQNFPGVEGQCNAQPRTETEAFGRTETRPQTNEYGEFIFCFHVHNINRVEPPTGIAAVEAYNFTHEFRFDPYTRFSFVPVKLDQDVPEANPQPAAGSYTVLGRLWQASSDRVTVEGIGVFGETVDLEPVDVTLRLADGTEIEANTTTNNYGDFAIRIPVTSPPTGGKVIVESRGQTFESDVDTTVGVSSFRGEMQAPANQTARNLLWGALVVAAVVVVGGGGWYAWKRVAEQREIAAARLSSTRKRARR